jgi:hypothetical protein
MEILITVALIFRSSKYLLIDCFEVFRRFLFVYRTRVSTQRVNFPQTNYIDKAWEEASDSSTANGSKLSCISSKLKQDEEKQSTQQGWQIWGSNSDLLEANLLEANFQSLPVSPLGITLVSA